jgi:hypothetical protein
MRALLLETDPRSGDPAERALVDAGHTVVRCHEPGAATFPCVGMEHPGSCPLDSPTGVDVAVVYRAHPHPRPTTSEDGVSCALRRQIPVVVAGTSALSPYSDWQAAAVDGADLVEVCEQVVQAPHGRLSAVATKAAEESSATATARVQRRGNQLFATVTVDVDPAAVAGPIGVRVAGALRAAEPTCRSIDVAVVHRDRQCGA